MRGFAEQEEVERPGGRAITLPPCRRDHASRLDTLSTSRCHHHPSDRGARQCYSAAQSTLQSTLIFTGATPPQPSLGAAVDPVWTLHSPAASLSVSLPSNTVMLPSASSSSPVISVSRRWCFRSRSIRASDRGRTAMKRDVGGTGSMTRDKGAFVEHSVVPRSSELIPPEAVQLLSCHLQVVSIGSRCCPSGETRCLAAGRAS